MRLYHQYLGGQRTNDVYDIDGIFVTKITNWHCFTPEVWKNPVWENQISMWLDKSAGSLLVKYYRVGKDHYHGDYSNGYISSFFGNCGICYISNLSWSSRELGAQFLNFLLDLSRKMGYTQVLYSVSSDQEGVIGLLGSKGFKLFKESTVGNKRSGNEIHIYYLNIRGEE